MNWKDEIHLHIDEELEDYVEKLLKQQREKLIDIMELCEPKNNCGECDEKRTLIKQLAEPERSV